MNQSQLLVQLFFDIEELNKKIEELLVCEDKISKLKEIVPEFDHRLN